MMETRSIQSRDLVDLRVKLTNLARNIRRTTIPDDVELIYPQSSRDDTVFFKGSVLKRKRIVLLAPACVTATCTMCPLPNEALDRKTRPISPEQIIQQFESSFEGERSLDDYELITVYNNGNFFADLELDRAVRKHIYKRVGESKASILVVESLPQFITPEKVEEAKELLGQKELAVAIGLQSSNDLVRELAVNSTCTKAAFERAVRLLGENGYKPLTFLMIKPPFLTEKEGIEDAVGSIKYLASLGIDDPILCATRVAPNTVAMLLREKGLFNPPWIWSVVEVLKKSSTVSPSSRPRVVLSELKPEINLDSACPQNCDLCSTRIIDLIDSYNKTGDVKVFRDADCDCRETYKAYVDSVEKDMGRVSLLERVRDFLDGILIES
ncbi:MAG: Radical SAM domain protein [Candidatus Curtissbacteria bacterium GW2011_GWC2_38_9]|uniref:Radical SAM domain protein n=2 Tax=Candidatus Curtissiibacteriota TaxID=1752717 RepID=A0A0G0LG79_9BACT|nr:MAG: Radical SAM domain protein [Candidatus Curtissbacteria bacterium GW2011_GWC2_38_9]KKS04611.1 MAG: Radical SAM domain protein [Candidatus Curtissbacteria bacterium GW2011_GWA2_41_24]